MLNYVIIFLQINKILKRKLNIYSYKILLSVETAYTNNCDICFFFQLCIIYTQTLNIFAHNISLLSLHCFIWKRFCLFEISGMVHRQTISCSSAKYFFISSSTNFRIWLLVLMFESVVSLKTFHEFMTTTTKTIKKHAVAKIQMKHQKQRKMWLYFPYSVSLASARQMLGQAPSIPLFEKTA